MNICKFCLTIICWGDQNIFLHLKTINEYTNEYSFFLLLLLITLKLEKSKKCSKFIDLLVSIVHS